MRSRSSRRFTKATVVSAVLHVLGALGLAQIRMPEPPPDPEPDRVLEIAFVARGTEQGDREASVAPPSPEPTPEQPVAEPTPQPAEPQPAPRPPVDVAPPPGPTVRFPALHRTQQPRAEMTPTQPSPKPTFAQWRAARMSPFVPNRIPDGGGSPDGTDAIDSEGRDRCTPFPNRNLERLYLLFDSSGSMNDTLRAQALSCAQQYAKAAIDQGATVVVGNFARSTTFIEPTRSMTDVAFALRAETEPQATMLPSTELAPFFEDTEHLRADLVILSDGQIPNYREVLPWYRYFLEINEGNRAYLYTLGTPGHPEVTAALRAAGFEIYVYRIL